MIYHYDLSGHLLAETSGTGAALRTYAWRDDTPIAQIDHTPARRILYFDTDHLNTPRAARDQSGNVVWRWESDAFGSTAPNENPGGAGVTTVNLRFPGQYYDQESGLYYNGHRYYDPGVGMYTQSDPIGLNGGSFSTYTYVGGNPLSYIDPFGLDLTPAQQTAVIVAAQDWTKAKVPYDWGGNTKKGADCSGSVSSIYNQAGISIGHLQSQEFTKYPFTTAKLPLQPGDVGVYPNHVDLYGGSNVGVSGNNVWSAFGTESSHEYFGPANSSWFGTPTWYRYNP